MLQPIHLFRYDSLYQHIYIIAGIDEGIEIIFLPMVNGSSLKMTQPNFSQMSRQELKAYILQNPTDEEAIRELFIQRWEREKVKSFPSPLEISKQELDEIFRQEN
jgi:hypothetical protein